MAQQYNSKDKADSANQNYTVKIAFGEKGRGAVTVTGRPVQKGSRVDQERKQKGDR